MVLNDEELDLSDDLDVIALSDSTWRVTDGQFALNATGLLAYLERLNGGRISVSVMSPAPASVTVAGTFTAALRQLSRIAAPGW